MKKLFISGLLLSAGLTLFIVKVSGQKKGPVLNHIALYVVDLQKSTRFYKEIVQIDTIPEPFKDGKHTWFSIGQGHLHLIEGAKAIVNREKDTHICFSVVSLEEFIARLEKNNIWYTNWKGDGKTPTLRADGVKQIYLKDPDGYWIEINNDKS
ncbi:MAG: VOC family protein [Chitinophagaceae bacterium]